MSSWSEPKQLFVLSDWQKRRSPFHFPPSLADWEYIKAQAATAQAENTVGIRCYRWTGSFQNLSSAGWTTASRHPFFMRSKTNKCIVILESLQNWIFKIPRNQIRCMSCAQTLDQLLHRFTSKFHFKEQVGNASASMLPRMPAGLN